MMTPRTVQQLLHVFRGFRDKHKSGVPLHRAYQEAVRSVADAHSITYQTIGDGCRRRLGLNDINELYDLLAAWANGDPKGLARQLKDSSDPSCHLEIDQFFANSSAPPTRPVNPSAHQASAETEIFQFRLSYPDARMLKALAELEGMSASELIGRSISAVVHDRMAAIARNIINSVDAPAAVIR